MRGDVRSRRIAVVADAVLNPAGGDDRLAELTAQDWGIVALCPAGLVPAARDAWLDAVVEQVVTFVDDGYRVVLVDPDDSESLRFAQALRATGRSLAG